jgi:hypothetical protein
MMKDETYDYIECFTANRRRLPPKFHIRNGPFGHSIYPLVSNGSPCTASRLSAVLDWTKVNASPVTGGPMKKWMLAPCLLLATILAAQTNSPVPAGTALIVRLDTTLATFSNKPGDPFRASISQPVVVNGQTLLPVGTIVEGRVTKISEPRRISGKPTIGILPEAVIMSNGERYYLDATLTDTNIQGTDVSSEGQFKGSTHDRHDTIEQGGGAAGGMLIGGLAAGPAGVLVGGLIGAGATTGHWLAKHRSATLPAGTELTLELNRPLTFTGTTASAAPSGGGSK